MTLGQQRTRMHRKKRFGAARERIRVCGKAGALISNPPVGRDVLFWSQGQRNAGFRMIDRVPMIVKSRPIAAGEAVYPLTIGDPLELDFDLDANLESQRSASLINVHNGMGAV